MTETDYGREPQTIVELTQPRCSLRFGQWPCRAALQTGQLRTNEALYSQAFANAYWTKGNVTVADGAGAAPGGAMTATSLIESATATTHIINISGFSFLVGLIYTWSVYVKNLSGTRRLQMALPSAAFGVDQVVNVNPVNGAVNATAGGVTVAVDILPSGWFRVAMTTVAATASAAGAARFSLFDTSTAALTRVYTGDGVSGLLIFGAQLEVGSGASTYKPTTSAPVSEEWGSALRLCYQTWGSCGDRESINTDGSLAWRFRKPDGGIMPIYAETGDDISTNPVPMLVNVTTSSSAINSGAQRAGQSPLGIRSTATVTLQDAPWDDHVGDFSLASRASVQGNFWAKWRARNLFYGGMTVAVYEGYKGQALASMQRRDYVLDAVDGPDASGRVTLRGADPLRLAELKDAQFPKATDIRLQSPIGISDVAIRVIAAEADLSANYGNTGARRYAAMGREIILYTGYTLVSVGVYDLTGVARAQLGSDGAAQSAGSVLQRCGRYENLRLWEIAGDLIDNHTAIPAGYRDVAGWTLEGNDYLITQFADATIPAPTGIERLLGELCQQGSFSIWWDERLQKIPLLANRPPKETPVELTDTLNILAGSAVVSDDPDAQITRVSIYYNPRNPFDIDRPENYRTLRLSIDGEVEAPAAANAVRTLTIYARFVTRDANAFRLATRLLLRYRLIPKYLSLELDAKDRSIGVGSVVAVTTGAFVDTEGGLVSSLWQVVRADEFRPGDALRVELQSYFFLWRFAVIMPNTATDDYATATDAERLVGCYIADETTGLMPGGDPPYLIQ